MANKFFIWSCGERSSFFIENDYFHMNNVIGFIDTYKTGYFKNKKIYLPEEALLLVKEQNVLVIVTTRDKSVNKAIYNLMQEMGFPTDNAIFVYNNYVSMDSHRIHIQQTDVIEQISPKLFREIRRNQAEMKGYFEMNPCQYDQVDENRLIGKGDFSTEVYTSDYIRFRTFEFVASEIEKAKTAGSIAELGVFQGVFAKLLNEKFPSRKLFLFDSFEGFIPEEFVAEQQKGNCDETFQDYFRQTDVTRVTRCMPHPEMCVIRKGFFPKSIEKEDWKEQFAFVSIDVDFEESTLEGLRFFYPRLVENGYIFLHDYNNDRLIGVKNAVERYEKEIGIVLKKVPICDISGTLIITKSMEHKTEIDEGWQNFITMKLWMDAKIEGKSFDTYFSNYDYQHVALYGAGEMGKLLLKELKKTSIQVDYFIDLRAAQLREVEGIPVVSIEEAVKQPVDVVIVTPLDQYERIYKDLLVRAPEMGVISLREIVYEL